MTTTKPTLWPPLDHSIGGGYEAIKINIPEFQAAFEFHDRVYEWIWEGIATKTLAEYDEDFHEDLRATAYTFKGKENWKWVKLRRYALYCYDTVRIWACEVRPTFEAWKPGDPALKTMYSSDGN